MEFKIQQKPTNKHQAYITDDTGKINLVPGLSEEESAFVRASFDAEQTIVTINRYSFFLFIYLLKNKKTDWQTADTCRKAGADIQAVCNKHKLTEITVSNLSATANAALLFAEGMALANYQFLKYRTNSKKTAN